MAARLDDLKLQKQSLDNEKIKLDNIFEMLKSFDTFYDSLSKEERKEIYNVLVEKIEIYPKNEEHQEIRLKSITFKFPIFSDHFINKKIEEDMDLNLFATISNKEECNYVNETLFIRDGPNELKLEKFDKEVETTDSPSITRGINNDVMKYVKENFNLNVVNQSG